MTPPVEIILPCLDEAAALPGVHNTKWVAAVRFGAPA